MEADMQPHDQAVVSGLDDVVRLKELLVRAETERLHLQKRAVDAERCAAATEAAAAELHTRLATAAAERTAAAAREAALTAAKSKLEGQLAVVRREYMANEILAVGLRERITALARALADARAETAAQIEKMSGAQGVIDGLTAANADLSSRLEALSAAHETAKEELTAAQKAAEEAALELADVRARAAREAEAAAALLAAAEREGLAEKQRAEEAEERCEERGRELEAASRRCQQFEAELSDARGLAMLLGKTAELQGASGVPPSDAAVWGMLGALGGLQHTLDVVLQHLRAQEAKVRGADEQVEQLEDRLRSESKQREALVQDLLDAQLLYSKAVCDRESFESRAATAEGARAEAEAGLQCAAQQSADDSARLKELQASVLSLSETVALLQPLQPKVETLEAERASLEARAARLEEALQDALHQLEVAQARKQNAKAEAVGYKGELAASLDANRQLINQAQALNARVQALEIASREGDLAAEHLEATRRRLDGAKASLGEMADSHRRALRELESEVARARSGSASGSRPASSAGPRASPRTQQGAAGASRPGTAATGTGAGSRSASSGLSRPRTAEEDGGAASSAGATAWPPPLQGSGDGSSADRGGQAATGQGDAVNQQQRQRRRGRSGGAAGQHQATAVAGSTDGQSAFEEAAGLEGYAEAEEEEDDEDLYQPAPRLPREVVRALEAEAASRGAPRGDRLAALRQVSALCAFVDRLRRRLLEQTERSASLEVQLLRAQEAEILRTQKQQQESAAAAAAEGEAQLEALRTLLAALRSLRTALAGGEEGESAGAESLTGEEGTGTAEAPGSCGGSFLGPQEGSGAGPTSAAASLTAAAAQVAAVLKSVAAEREARLVQIAGRKDKGAQADNPIEEEWGEFVASLIKESATAGGAVAEEEGQKALLLATAPPPPRHCLRPEACSEAVVRLYHRALREAEEWEADTEARLASARAASPRPQLGTAAIDARGGALHPTLSSAQQQQPPQQERVQRQWRVVISGSGSSPWTRTSLFDVLVAHYSQGGLGAGGDTAAWRDPEGPIARLLLSCRHHSPQHLKLECFLRFIGGAPSGVTWGIPQWGFLLLLLLGVKRVVAGLWHGILREWASLGGAQLPLQAVHDLLANLYNAQDISGLPPRVSAALTPLVVPGPAAGASVDLDSLLALLLGENAAGHLPQEPLLRPRRVTDGSMNNALNAWGVAAGAAAAAGPPLPGPGIRPGTSGSGSSTAGPRGPGPLHIPAAAAAAPWSPSSGARPRSSGSWGFGGGTSSRLSPLDGGAADAAAAPQQATRGSSLPRLRTPPDGSVASGGGSIGGPRASRAGSLASLAGVVPGELPESPGAARSMAASRRLRSLKSVAFSTASSS